MTLVFAQGLSMTAGKFYSITWSNYTYFRISTTQTQNITQAWQYSLPFQLTGCKHSTHVTHPLPPSLPIKSPPTTPGHERPPSKTWLWNPNTKLHIPGSPGQPSKKLITIIITSHPHPLEGAWSHLALTWARRGGVGGRCGGCWWRRPCERQQRAAWGGAGRGEAGGVGGEVGGGGPSPCAECGRHAAPTTTARRPQLSLSLSPHQPHPLPTLNSP